MTKPSRVLIIGSGPIVIGQAAEFDYSGSQACRSLREEGVHTVLVNSNPATIMTDEGIADTIYIEPLTVDIISRIIERERPDGLLPTLGGQTGLNLAVALADVSVLENYGVRSLGTPIETIRTAEDRDLFRKLLESIGEPSAAGIHTLHRAENLTILNVVWAPLMVLLPHNHKMWATIGIYTGREDNIIWRSAGPRVVADRAASLSEKEVFDLPDDAIHSVVNPIPRLTGAIHVYGGDFFAAPRSEWDSETLRERPFDLEGAREVFRKAARRFNCH